MKGGITPYFLHRQWKASCKEAVHQHPHILQTCKSADPSHNSKLRSPWAAMVLLQRSLGWQGKAAAPGALSRAQHSLLPRAAGCPTAAKEKIGEQIRAISTALAACKGWTMAVCRPKVKEGSMAPHCTSQSLWHRQPLSSDRCQNMLVQLQPRASFLWDSHKDPYTARKLPVQAMCLHCLMSNKTQTQAP